LGSAWYAGLNGAMQIGTGSSLEFEDSDGTYSFQIGALAEYLPTPSSGSVVVNGTAVVVQVAFTALTTYSIGFHETGLMLGTLWSVNLSGAIGASMTSGIEFNVPNGTYSFEVGGPSGYDPSPIQGSMVVNGASLSQEVLFHGVPISLSANISYQVEYANCFSDGGLTNYVLLGASATGGLAPYSYAWKLPTGNTSGVFAETTTTFGRNNSAALTVTDSAHHAVTTSVILIMELPPCPPPATDGTTAISAGSLSPDQWAIIGLTAALVAVTSVAVWLGRRGRGGSSTGPPTSTR
ncbi:MAG TPA: hypothetical protein VIZ68_05695, partial [Thermoplasmata archaeon]